MLRHIYISVFLIIIQVIHNSTGSHHSEYILSGCFIQPNTLVCCDDEGSLIAWNMRTCNTKCELRLSPARSLKKTQYKNAMKMFNRPIEKYVMLKKSFFFVGNYYICDVYVLNVLEVTQVLNPFLKPVHNGLLLS
jgi:hypothetical protein